jgi:hypothetical protein
VVWAKNFYSVPFTHIGAHVDLRVTDTMLEIYRGDERLTSHLLVPVTTTNQYRTNEADLPEGHSWQAWDRTRIDAWAVRLGPATGTVIEKIFESVRIEEAGYDPALAVLRLSRRFSPAGGGRMPTRAARADTIAPLRPPAADPGHRAGQDRARRGA